MASIRKKIFQIANSLACTNAYTKKKKKIYTCREHSHKSLYILRITNKRFHVNMNVCKKIYKYHKYHKYP